MKGLVQKTRSYVLHSNVITFGRWPRRTVILLHGIGNSGIAWRDVVSQLEGKDVRIIVIDLLGFGRSPRPKHAEYDVATQAKSVRLTCLLRGVAMQKVRVVGHSMGALVAIEYARRYPTRTQSLLLCSPPLYAPPSSRKLIPTSDALLRKLYTAVRSSPRQFLRLSGLAMKYELINTAFDVNDENIGSYMNALQAAIINQTSLDDIAKLTLPIHIVRGTLDPVLVPKHIKRLVRTHDNIVSSAIVAGHEVTGRFAVKVATLLKRDLSQ